MTPYITSHWHDNQAVGRKCAQCGFAATHSSHVPLAKGDAVTWYCTNHASTFARDNAIPFPCINGRTATPQPVAIARTPA